MKKLKENAKRMSDLIQEIERYSKYKKELAEKINNLFRDYQQGKYTYFQYKKSLKGVLGEKTKEEWDRYYDAYILSLLKRIELINSQIFYDAYKDASWKELRLAEKEDAVLEKREIKALEKEVVVPEVKKVTEEEGTKEAKAKARGMKGIISRIFKKEEKKKIPAPAVEIGVAAPSIPAPVVKKPKHAPKPPKPPRIIIKRPAERLRFVSTTEFLLDIIRRIFGIKKVTYIGKETTIPKQTLALRRGVPRVAPEVAPTAIAEEAARIRRILEKKEVLKIYQPSFFGSIANMIVKRISFAIIEIFPDLFRNLYNALRLANIQMLSNTYVNIMVLVSLITALLSLFFFAIFFSALGNTAALVAIKTVLMTILVAIITFVSFYAYPFMKIRERRRNIRAGLPFAINHMAAVASSGVAPVKMFKLISESKEYGEISTEIDKLVQFVEVFGYDFLTALKSVASTTPSPTFKEFLEGMISAIESGSDVKVYMMEKSKEAMLEYELERQKYTETISTYSDIYTGLLIAAPLFFMAALSLVSLLGGTIAGISVDVMIVVGTYIIIPLMNIIFLIILEMTQPEI